MNAGEGKLSMTLAGGCPNSHAIKLTGAVRNIKLVFGRHVGLLDQRGAREREARGEQAVCLVCRGENPDYVFREAILNLPTVQHSTSDS